MPIHLQREINKLRKMISALGALVEDQMRRAVKAMDSRDMDLAEIVIKKDADTDRVEVGVEEECLKILALYQPVAIDLRYIVAILKINSDLERIGDLAVNIADQVHFLDKGSLVQIPFDLHGMSEKVQKMVKSSLDALVNLDTALARRVCESDNEVDDLNRQMHEMVSTAISNQDFARLKELIHWLTVTRNLERMADHATNIAEDVIYMVEGEIIRHRF